MRELILPEYLAKRVSEIYARLESEYGKVATAIGLDCRDCSDNCCDSYFLHHTYLEWAYLWRGLRALPARQLEEVRGWADRYRDECRKAEQLGQRPQVMCPLNERGLCILYAHRLLVCRTHGVPAKMRRPDGRQLDFPGCFRCQELVAAREQQGLKTPRVDRTALLTELARIEDELLEHKRHRFPRVRMTIAEMILQGPPLMPEDSE